MCGLCGIYHPGEVIDADTLQQMTAVLRHRGPDGEGLWQDQGIGLGHRRLSIIDPVGGQQPLHRADQRLSLVFNGEIYNYLELKQELARYGHAFHTASDTEVLLRAYEHWGLDCVHHFNGMFAFALWDGDREQLLLARDHLGIKPLYYRQQANCLWFASEIKSLLRAGPYPANLDTDALSLLFSFRFVPSPRTLFSGIYKLPPGHRLVATAAGIALNRYWNPRPVIRTRWNEADLREEYASRLTAAVTRQLRSDVPVGLFLSSGVDSATLLALMSQQAERPVKTYTLGFADGEDTSELADAARLAAHFGAEHHTRTITADDYLDYFARYMQDIEEPVAHEPAPAFHFLAGLAAREVKVVLSGQGADEPWAGYDRYRGLSLSRYYARLPVGLTRFIAAAALHIPLPLERFKRGAIALAEPDLTRRLAGIYSFFSPAMKEALYRGPLREQYQSGLERVLDIIRGWQSGITHLDPLAQMLYIDTRAGLPDDLLMVADKTSMAHSLEVRVPYLDHSLIGFIESLPVGLKLHGMTGKYLHKQTVARWLPQTVVSQRKKGFAHPVDRWLKTRFRPLIEDLVLGPDSPLLPYFDRGVMQAMYHRYRAGQEPLMRHFYLLLSLALWLRAYQAGATIRGLPHYQP
jgi:asparagine synthase (glutamine-hydrolysing)